MYFRKIFVLVFYTSTATAKIFQSQECSPSDFNCFDGTCLSLSKYCDGVSDCADGSDEATCDTGTDGEWSCRDGSCISRRGKCDGEVHCRDGSDETSAICGRNSCDETEFRCAYGACVSAAALCNGIPDCADSSDELAHCYNQNTTYDTLWEEPVSHNRIKRQARISCRKNQWRCADGSCISVYGKCDGIMDCLDGSDETFALCRKTPLKIYKKASSNLYKSLEQKLWKEQAANLTKPKKPIRCQSNWFRCTYGACVDGTAPCNNVQECVDNSDELLRRCRNQTEEVRGTFKCDDGQEIDAFTHCDGTKDCADGSDETVKACAGKTCASYLFQCAYGACVDQGSDCNNKIECADGSDEFDDLCNRTSTAVVTPGGNPLSGGGACKLPPYPKHGAYVVSGQTQDSIGLKITCDPGYGVVGPAERVCFLGTWTPTVVTDCVRFCRLNKDPSVQYRCLLTGAAEGSRECDEYEPDGTVIHPKCNSPNYYYSGVLSYMRCIEGSWDYVARCNAGSVVTGVTWSPCDHGSCKEFESLENNEYTRRLRDDLCTNFVYKSCKEDLNHFPGPGPMKLKFGIECGRVVPKGIELIIGGRPAERGELPWHAGIYKKTTTPYMQVCGGSLVSAKVVISAAHCFWNDTHKALPAENYAIALGKLYRPWAFKGDQDVQRSDVSEIKLTPRFQGGTTNFQDDIAVLLLVTLIEYKPHIRPVCVDFNIVFENRQLSAGNKGKVAGWGLSSENGVASQFLKVVELPYISIQECQTDAPLDFREYITGDKICAGYRNGTALCKGDSGGGLAFPESDRGTLRYYLRGIVSTAPNNDNLCNAYWLTTFTQVSRHEHFINNYL